MNYGASAVDVDLGGTFATWSPQYDVAARELRRLHDNDANNKDGGGGGNSRAVFSYPTIPTTKVSLASGETKTATIAGLQWGLGEGSYWWPNKPFVEDYAPTLHTVTMTATLRDARATISAPTTIMTTAPPPVALAMRRFGFVEWSEAANNGTWYVVNGRRINFISDATPEAAMSSYDCYSTSPAFATLEGARETWKRYMRLGISANRIHQSTPTEIMLQAAGT